MRGRLGIVVFASLLCAACGPSTYSVYDGGLAPSGEKPVPLQPTETVALYSTNYAPPEPNETLGGPTNRVRVDVPEEAPFHAFLRLTTSTRLACYRQISPVRGQASARRIRSEAESMPVQSIGASAHSRSLSETSRENALAQAGGLTVGASLGTHGIGHSSANITSRTDDSALADRTKGAASVDLVDRSALQQPAGTVAAMRTQTTVGTDVYYTSKHNRTVSDPTAAGNVVATLKPESAVGVFATRSVAKPGQPLAGQTLATIGQSRTTGAPADMAAAASLTSVTKGKPAVVLGAREAVAAASDRGSTLRSTASEGPVSYGTLASLGSYDEKTSLAGRSGALAAGDASNSKATLTIGRLEATEAAAVAQSLMRALTIENAETTVNVKAIVSGGDSSVTGKVAAVSPPWLTVVKEGRLIGFESFEKLIERGLLDQMPRSAAVIRYRILVFNESSSSAVDVRVVDNLDSDTGLLTCATSKPANVTYDVDESTVTIAIDGLEPLDYLLVEFYVELER